MQIADPPDTNTPVARADTAALAAQLERRVALLTRWLRSVTRSSRSVGALLTLVRLEEQGPMRITDLAAAEAVSQPTMTGLVQRLEEDGFVRRSADPRDARAVRVVLTAAGRRELEKTRRARATALRSRLDELDSAALAELTTVLPALDHLLKLTQESHA